MNSDRMLTVRETAEFLGCGKSTLWRWMKTIPDFPPIVRLGIRKRGFKVSDLLAYLERKSNRRAV